MNEFQMAQQFKFILNQAVWPGSANPVFGAAVISPKTNADLLGKFNLPLGVIRLMAGQADPSRGEEPLLFRQTIAVRLLVANEHDGELESAIIGANRKSTTDSDGRGLLEIQERLLAELGRITGINGARIINTWRSRTDVLDQEHGTSVAVRDYLFDAMIGNDRFYFPATRFLAVDAAAPGDADLTWRLPPSRFDFVNVKILRKVGSTPPSGPADGTVILASGTGVSFVDSPSAGTFSYGIFGAYDEDGDTPVAQNVFSLGDTSTITVT